MTLSAIDLFSGAGGISFGLGRAGFSVLAACDVDAACAATHRRNLAEIPLLESDIRDVSSTDLLSVTGLSPGELDLLIGGPPCQGFSIIGSRVVHDPRNDLFREFLRIGAELRPRTMVIENVPGLATLAGGVILQEILEGFRQAGYSCGFAELLAAQYGVPQMRWRMVIVGFRRDTGIEDGLGFPLPTHGRRKVGELVPNCTIPPEDTEGFRTTADAIGDLPPVGAGEEVGTYVGEPSCEYQREMRGGLGDELYNHYAPKLSPQNIARIVELKPGEDWRSLPRHLLPASMLRAKRKDHTRRYRRMTWNGIPRAIITRFRDPKSGEYIHPEQHRTISIREAARIQSFPDSYIFEGNHSQQYDQVGNAVPPILAEAIAREVASCLRGESTSRIVDPFVRRPSIRQARLPLYASEETISLIG